MSVSVSVNAVGNRPPIAGAIRKFFAFYRVYFADALAYRASMVIWLLTDTVPAIIMPLIWLASFHGRPTIQGFNPSQMVVYYLVILFLSCIVESHIMWDMMYSVKEGKMTMQLARPFSLMGATFAQNISFRLMRSLIFVPLFAIVLSMFRNYVHWNPADYNISWQFWLSVLLGHMVSFMITYAMGLLSLYFVEVGSIYNFYYLPLILFNGQIAPLSLFPKALAQFGSWLPFTWTMGFPAQVFIGQVHGDAVMHGFVMQIGWIIFGWVASIFLYREGIKRFTAFGI